jgi:chitinase
VNVPASKISMGFGFYGRSFQFANHSCTTPGCPFTGTADAGPCSATGGILMYYEIMALLAQNPSLVPTWDKTAAVKYINFKAPDGTTTWVSYDDADTFKQKVDFANNIGLSGALIWASDTGKLSKSLYDK